MPYARKLFFFVDYQGTRKTQGIDTGLIAVPSLADRRGDLSDQAAALTGSVSGGYFAQLLSSRLGYAVQRGEPYYTPSCTLATCVFPGGIIPEAALSQPGEAPAPLHSTAESRQLDVLPRQATRSASAMTKAPSAWIA